MTRTTSLRPRTWVLIALIAVLMCALLAVAATIVLRPEAPPATSPTPSRTQTPTSTPTPSPTPTPTPTGFPANTNTYDTSTLPQAEVFAILPQLPVDTDPAAPFAGYTAHPIADAVPIWADPLAEPVAALLLEQRYGGTTVAVVEKQENWVRVLLTGRQSVPSGGDPGQLTGWLRASDVELVESTTTVEVSLSARTIDIVRDGVAERIADDFGSGAAQSPTPVGRTSIHLTEVTSFEYTRGHPIVYLSLQSPALDGFGGTNVAVTAFHYHDAHSGAISNGCIRLDAGVITRLAELPEGTGVSIRP